MTEPAGGSVLPSGMTHLHPTAPTLACDEAASVQDVWRRLREACAAERRRHLGRVLARSLRRLARRRLPSCDRGP